MRRVTGDAAFGFQRRVFINERTLLVGVTLNAGRVGTDSETRLLEFKPAMRVVTVAALHCAFQHFVVERQIELVFRLTMTTETKLGLAISK